jgi:hypothetical protein
LCVYFLYYVLILIYLFKFQPKATAIPKGYPFWASWNSRDVHLPAIFHSAESFEEAFSILENTLGDSSVIKDGKIDPPLLLLGLMYREVSRAMEVEPGAGNMLPIHLVNSAFGIKELQRIEGLIQSVQLPSTN